jgi:hypothetical protein
MEPGGRWTSLADISRMGSTPLETPPADPRLHRSLEDIRADSLNPMVDILDQGSPASGGSPDPMLLDDDDDSDGRPVNRECSNSDNIANISNIVVSDSTRSTEDLTVTPMMVEVNTTSDIAEDPLYHQCRTARRTSHSDKLVSITGDITFGSCVSSQSPPVGSLVDHSGLSDTFHGSRIREGATTVNQSISVSFDPSKLLCVTCKTEHSILGKKPVTIFFSDQNFIASMEGNGNSCLNCSYGGCVSV